MVVWKYGIISHVFTLHSLLDLWTTPVGGVDIHSLNGVFKNARLKPTLLRSDFQCLDCHVKVISKH